MVEEVVFLVVEEGFVVDFGSDGFLGKFLFKKKKKFCILFFLKKSKKKSDF